MLVPTTPVPNQGVSEAIYEDDWRLYYVQRRAILRRLAQSAFATAIVVLTLAVIPTSIQPVHPLAMKFIGALAALCVLATAFQWFRFNWVLGGWRCPRCRKPFFHSTFVRNPFGNRCRHCSLRRLKESEIAHTSQA